MKIEKKIAPAVILILAIALGALYYEFQKPGLPKDITSSNGRIEAQTIDVATRSGGRVLDVAVEEGAMVQPGDVIAKIDLNNIAASLAGAQANVRASEQQKDAANSAVSQAQSAFDLTQKEYNRVSSLVQSGAVSRSRYDQTLSQKQTAEASLDAAKQRLASASESVDVARAEVDRLTDLLSDKDLKSPRAARVLYKLAQPGEVIPSGGKVVTLIDLSDVYMTCFFSTDVVGKLKMGDEARIILDALPGTAIPAYISYISPDAQFTPRQVETKAEREKMSFRVKVRIPASLLQKHMDVVKTGLPGMAYVRTDASASWPEFLAVRPDIMKEAIEN